MPVQIKRLQKDIESINAFNATPGNGITRQTFSKEYQGATGHIVSELQKIGSNTSICLAGNIRSRIPGSAADGPAIMVGSHLDTVAHGGRFDGVVGVATALEVARCMVEDRIPHRLPVDVVIFAEEEGSRFGRSLLGSSIWAGKMAIEKLHQITDANGVSYSEAMSEAGLTIDDDRTLTPPDLKAMLEVHIEQGGVLEKKGYRIGVVQAIAGIRQRNITIRGKANHAGTTPMPDRSDALQAAARIIVAVDEIAASTGPNTVATVGRISCEPSQVNVIPSLVRFSVDIRDSNKEKLDAATARISRIVEETCAKKGLKYKISSLAEIEPIVFDDRIVHLLEKITHEKDATPLRMMSGAGHDTGILGGLTQAGMIFLPSREGYSHCRQEFTRMEDIVLGCDILLAAVVELAK